MSWLLSNFDTTDSSCRNVNKQMFHIFWNMRLVKPWLKECMDLKFCLFKIGMGTAKSFLWFSRSLSLKEVQPSASAWAGELGHSVNSNPLLWWKGLEMLILCLNNTAIHSCRSWSRYFNLNKSSLLLDKGFK